MGGKQRKMSTKAMSSSTGSRTVGEMLLLHMRHTAALPTELAGTHTIALESSLFFSIFSFEPLPGPSPKESTLWLLVKDAYIESTNVHMEQLIITCIDDSIWNNFP